MDSINSSKLYVSEPKKTKTSRCCIVVPDLKAKSGSKKNAGNPEREYGRWKIEYYTDKLKHRMVQGFDFKGMIESLNSGLVYTAGVLVIACLIFAAMYGTGLRIGYHVYVGSEQVGTVLAEDDLEQAVGTARDRITGCLGEDYTFEQQPYLKMGIVNVKDVSKDLPYQIIATVGEVEDAVAVKVDGEVITAFADEKMAEMTVNGILQRYQEDNPGASVSFASNVELVHDYVPSVLVKEPQQALEILTGFKEEPVVHTIAEDETFWSISKDYKVSVDDIIEANPDLVPETIKPGMQVHITRPAPVLSIRTEQVVGYETELAFAVEQEEDAGLYEGKVTVARDGQPGKKWVEAKVVKINGEEVESQVLSEQVTIEPVAQIEMVGTKPVPTTSGSGEFTRPYYGAVSSRFGSRWGRSHKGVDLSGRTGDPVAAADGGKVVSSGWDNGGYGYLVIIDHENGYQTYYAHCSELLVSAGDRVAKGDTIAKVGSTGDSTGPHLHFEVRVNGTPVDPMGYIN